LRPLAALVALALMLAAVPHAQQPSLDDFFARFTDEWVRGHPNLAIATRYFSGSEQNALERQLTPLTADFQRERAKMAARGLAELRSFDRARMTPAERVSADLMAWQIELLGAGVPFGDYVYPLEQFAGANVALVSDLTVVHPLGNEQDASNYLVRLALVDTRMNEAVAEAKRIAAAGVIPPRFILDATIAQMQQFVEAAPARNPFASTLEERLRTMAGLSDARRAELAAAAERIVADEIYPAWKSAIGLLQEQRPHATDEAGLSRFKSGAAAYAYQLQRFTTTDLTAEEIHQIGLREVARIEKEMDAILRQLGRTEGTVKARIDRLRVDLQYPRTEQGRAAIMADIDRMIRDAERRADTLFDRRPRARVIAQPYPPFREASAAASYSAPPFDASRPGIFQMPLRPDRMTKFGLRSLVYHETVPGHHFHIALGLEDESVPRFRRIRAFGTISSVVEGWALYAERLAAESGWYEDDLEGRLGQLDAELFRARRLVVDTGLHAKGWTRQQAIDYGIEPSEVERYVVYPGQACAYLIGQLKIVELRERARAAMGERFSMKGFHNAVLAAGTVPLQILESEIDAYIQSGTSR
jgi:uncharacterized protein (DUF885 family)